MILAGVPIACGTQSPSTPDTAMPTAMGDAASVSALRARPVPLCAKGDRSHIRSIGIEVLSQGPGYATVRAMVASSSGPETLPPVCVEPIWQVFPNGRIVMFDLDRATIYAAPGKYEVTASTVVKRPARRIWASTTIVIV
jgi:hypothetical protein